jgi:hypothetical protein
MPGALRSLAANLHSFSKPTDALFFRANETLMAGVDPLALRYEGSFQGLRDRKATNLRPSILAQHSYPQ